MEQLMIADNQQATFANLSWLGGIIDGEGCISFQKSGRKKKSLVPKIIINNTEIELINTCSRVLDYCKLPYFIGARKGRGNQKDSSALIISGWKRSFRFLPYIISHLIVKREQAELMLQFCVIRLNSKSKIYSDFEKDLCRQIYQLNGRVTIPTFDQ